jgi:hypothetical protein
MGKLYNAAAGVFAAMLIAFAAYADGPDISAQRLLSAWKGEDPNMRMIAEVIASAFASGLSWKGTLPTCYKVTCGAWCCRRMSIQVTRLGSSAFVAP